MNANGENLSGSEDFMEAEIEAAHMDSPEAEMQVRDALQKLPGIVELDLSKGKVSVRYDPTLTSQKHIAEAAASAGHAVQKANVSRGPGHADSPAPTANPPEKP